MLPPIEEHLEVKFDSTPAQVSVFILRESTRHVESFPNDAWSSLWEIDAARSYCGIECALDLSGA
jgi:hypothetical protein